MNRFVPALALGAVGMTVTSLISEHALPPVIEVVTFLVLLFATYGVVALVRSARHKARR